VAPGTRRLGSERGGTTCLTCREPFTGRSSPFAGRSSSCRSLDAEDPYYAAGLPPLSVALTGFPDFGGLGEYYRWELRLNPSAGQCSSGSSDSAGVRET